MKFSSKKRRQAPTIIIISLIDILIVLLIFMMVTTTFKQQPALKLILPESKQASEGNSDDAHQLTITVAKQEPFFYLGRHAVTWDRLQEELAASASKDPRLSISIRADAGATVDLLFKAWNATHAAGIKNVRMLTKRSEAR